MQFRWPGWGTKLGLATGHSETREWGDVGWFSVAGVGVVLGQTASVRTHTNERSDVWRLLERAKKEKEREGSWTK